MTALPHALESKAAQQLRTLPVLRLGAQGPAVKLLQERLAAARLDPGQANGSFGAQTHYAVTLFQEKQRLPQTGVVTPQTWSALLAESAPAPRVASDLPTLRLCSQGPAVTQLQERLQAAGLNPGAVDGYFGTQTRWSVQAFQRANGLDVNGVVGSRTWERLLAVTAASPEPSKKQPGAVAISSQGKAQLQRLVAFARANRTGRVGGRSFQFVWRYLTSVGYGKLTSPGDLPDLAGSAPRDFADYLNASPARLREAGLQRVEGISNPHDPRIPAGAVIVVAAGSTGAGHPLAGEIFVKGASPGEFINDGDFSGWMGDRSTWCGRVLGVYVPE